MMLSMRGDAASWHQRSGEFNRHSVSLVSGVNNTAGHNTPDLQLDIAQTGVDPDDELSI